MTEAAKRILIFALVAWISPVLMAADYSLVTDGRATSCIVLPDNAGPVERHAAAELARFLEKVSGAKVGAATTPAIGLYPVHLGTTAATNLPRSESINLAVSQLESEGFVLAADRDGLRIISRRPAGVLFGAYEILKKHAGLRWFAPGDEFEHCPQEVTIGVPEQVTISNPSFKFRSIGFVCANTSSRVIDTWDWFVRNGMIIRIGKPILKMHQAELEKRAAQSYAGGHSFAYLLSDKLFPERPQYFGLFDGKRVPQNIGDGKGARRQPCTSNPEVVKIMAENLNQWLDSPPEGGHYLVGNNDAQNWCECDECAKLDPPGEKAKRFVSTRYMTLVNQVADLVYKTRPDADLWAWAYQNFQTPPTGVAPDRRLTIEPCVHGRCYRHSIADETCLANAKFRDMLTGWMKFGNPVVTREYDESFQGSPPYIPAEKVFCRDIRHYHRIGLAGFRLIVPPPDGTFGPLWNKVKWKEFWYATWQMRYLAAQLAWNVDTDYDTAVEDMGSRYYGPAWPDMKRYREELIRMYEETPGHMCYGTPDYLLGKCLEKPGVEAMLLGLLDRAEKAATGNRAILARIQRDRRYFRLCWQSLHQEFLRKRQNELTAGKRLGKITLDGTLDESDWKNAAFTGNFIDLDGKTPADPQTFVRTLYDTDAIYFGIEAMEPEPDAMKIKAQSRDDPVWSDSSLKCSIATPGLNGKYCHLVVNPRGTVYDSLAVGGGDADITFDCKPEIKTALLDDRWIAEIRVPTASLGRKIQDGETWKVNVARNRRLTDGRRQSSSWSNGSFHGSDAFRSVVFGDKALLANGDFEDAAAPGKYQERSNWRFASDKIPVHWVFHSGVPGTATLLTGDAGSGKQYLKIEDGWIHQKLQQSPDYRDNLLFRAKARGAGTLTIAIYRYNRDSGKHLSTVELKGVSLDSREWTDIDAVYTCETDNILRLAFWVKGEIDIDDVSVTQEANLDVAPIQ